MEEWLIIQSFFNGLNTPAQNRINAASGGSFLSLSVPEAKALVEKIASNQSWKGERQQQPRKGVHQINNICQDGLSHEETGVSTPGNGDMGSRSSVRFWITLIVGGARHTDPASNPKTRIQQS